MEYYRGLLEAILFLSNEPLSVSLLARKIQLDKTNTRILLDSLVDEYLERSGGILLKEIAGGYRFLTSEKYSEELKKIFKPKSTEKLSRSLLETLAIICYKQPITLSEIEEIRGVNSRNQISILLQKNLIKPQGYKPVPGRPTLYVTTREFLIKFNLNTLADLPPLKDLKELPFDEITLSDEEESKI
ncbi:MAG: SMC-Scp complex subunit ScpB [Leptonema sp. (in: bacteria)]